MGKICAAIGLSIVVLPLVVSLLLHISAVQNFVVQKAVRMISSKLQTTVAIRRVDVSLLGKARIEGFYVEDYQHDTLLYVDRLDAYITSIGLLGGGLTFSRGELVGAKLCLRETPEGEMNIKQVVNRISDPDRPRKGNFRLALREASIADMELCLERNRHRDPPFGIDFGHMHLYDMTARIADFTLDGQAICTTIDDFAARERSGFVLDRLAGRFYLVNGCLGFEEVAIRTPRSHVSIPYISLVGDSWADYKDFVGEVQIDGALRNSSVSTDDIAYFSPGLREWHTLLSEINADIDGTVADFAASIRSLRLGESTYLTATATVRG
ncbi:MAG: hypothetical protein K2G66_01610, partial [Alistipes sp.]|nr:hypothetical protein [Alistipes sp.]